MTINQVRYFLAIVEHKSFSLAAYELFISQSSISKQIKSLEEELGIVLFKREHAKVFLTKPGELFLAYAKKVSALHHDMLRSIEDYQNQQVTTIRMGSIPVVSSYGVGGNIAAFTKALPEHKKPLGFDMLEDSQYTVLKNLLDGHLDLALLRLESLDNLEQYDILPFKLDDVVFICHKDCPLASHKSVTFEEIAAYPLMLLSHHSALHKLIIKEFEKRQLKIDLECTTTRHKVLMEMLSSNAAVTLIPSSLLDPFLFPRLTAVPLATPLKSMVALIKLKSNKLNKITKTFWQYWAANCTLKDVKITTKLPSANTNIS